MVDSGSGGGSGGGESMKERRRSDGVRTEVGLDLPPATSFLFNTLSLSLATLYKPRFLLRTYLCISNHGRCQTFLLVSTVRRGWS